MSQQKIFKPHMQFSSEHFSLQSFHFTSFEYLHPLKTCVPDPRQRERRAYVSTWVLFRHLKKISQNMSIFPKLQWLKNNLFDQTVGIRRFRIFPTVSTKPWRVREPHHLNPPHQRSSSPFPTKGFEGLNGTGWRDGCGMKGWMWELTGWRDGCWTQKLVGEPTWWWFINSVFIVKPSQV